MASSASKRALSGVLLLDKPVGVSSNTALQKARRLFGAQKAGHTGVLDPLASGLLPICFGEATKFAQYLLDADKAYTATMKLGEATTTGDAEGDIIATSDHAVSAEAFQAACTRFTGPVRQVPPMFSALKHEGRPLYEYARKGIVIERKPRDICIHAIEIEVFSPPLARIAVRCSKGTYIRTLSEDIAKHIGTFAHLTALRRTATAGFSIAQSHTLEALAEMSAAERDAVLLPCDVLVQHFPSLVLDGESIAKLGFGQSVDAGAGCFEAGQPVRIYSAQHDWIGLAHYRADTRRLHALRLMNTSSTQHTS